MASSSSFLSEDQFQCSICLDVFTEPVSIPCGHNFCKACISRYWNTTARCRCPLCKHIFYKRPELKTNTTLRNVADHFKRMSDRDRDLSPAKPGEVACDLCTGRKLKALKSCLECLTSYCEIHLQPHQRVAGLKRHKLIDPVENLEAMMCKKHDRLLELFCRTDQTCVCQFCTETDHKTHHTVPLEEEFGKKKAQLRNSIAQMRQMIHDRWQKVREIKDSVELSKRVAERERADSVEVFNALVRSIERSQAELIVEIEEKQKAEDRRAKGLINELELEITALKRRRTELEQLSHTEDHLHLLQSSPSLCTPTFTKDWSEISVHYYLHVKNVRRVVSQLEETLHNEMEKLPDIKLKRMQQYAVDVTLDPDTAFPYLNVSEDRKQVTLGDVLKTLPNNPERFDYNPSILGKNEFSSGRFYYEVQVEGKTWWRLGVARKSANRKGWLPLTPENGFWTLGLKSGYHQYHRHWYCANMYDNLFFLPFFSGEPPTPQKVGVFVDYEEGLVSFYDVKARSHIHSFTSCNFTEKLYTYFNSGGNAGGKNTAPLVISTVNHTE
ncbi:E3 ubiquitin-protein ligase TRIM21-like [Salvelinus namaycush]|uniref:E3 ubiquitin-protein ligase TRIM21-like n=1 Tax=Salvelinus namaycush TaxID=8040 RepID=A0A8U0PTS7_SALNM|nr:E3 ubiquitin-protein ligase TRIM21-like [Salvelinus namaycush]